jgi:hypothetical protein
MLKSLVVLTLMWAQVASAQGQQTARQQLGMPGLEASPKRFTALTSEEVSDVPVVAGAQLYPRSASEVSEATAQELFRRLKIENGMMSPYSECFQRAHLWAHQAERDMGIITEKVFVYFTYKFEMRHRVTTRWGRAFAWWFHVAPAVRVNGELWVLDATFTDRAMPMQQWAMSLQKNPEECQVMQTREEYANDRNATNGYRNRHLARETCYLTNAPRFLYQPLNMGLYEENLLMHVRPEMMNPTVWSNQTLRWSLDAYSNRDRRNQVRRIMRL